MQKSFTKYDVMGMILEEHSQVVDTLVENLKTHSGKGKDKKPFLSSGLKIIHEESGLIYTVVGLSDTGQETVLVCIKPTGERFEIPTSKFGEYKRL